MIWTPHWEHEACSCCCCSLLVTLICHWRFVVVLRCCRVVVVLSSSCRCDVAVSSSYRLRVVFVSSSCCCVVIVSSSCCRRVVANFCFRLKFGLISGISLHEVTTRTPRASSSIPAPPANLIDDRWRGHNHGRIPHRTCPKSSPIPISTRGGRRAGRKRLSSQI